MNSIEACGSQGAGLCRNLSPQLSFCSTTADGSFLVTGLNYLQILRESQEFLKKFLLGARTFDRPALPSVCRGQLIASPREQRMPPTACLGYSAFTCPRYTAKQTEPLFDYKKKL
ncbi:uncharacterized protein CTRU02_204676 [Colletotrichum truncatum]|uniref:Uncharacterized protein n=1 Tax=Colletotrichum truncatum TaxID=5467 RepID=A0ACC3ZDB9_COLTU|nr:uncharacterized protein CTRU02_02909 [Colletotrichum truncatum]KAF6797867.1 hypothetical protein CTRU02_02909 [Colletotrichum truncatum]